MTELWSLRPLWAVLIPFIASILIVFSGSRPNLRESWTVIAALALWFLIGSLLHDFLIGRAALTVLWEIVPGVAFAFHADAAGLVFALVSSTLWIATAFYSIGYARSLNLHSQTRFFSLFAVCLGAAIGIALAENLITFFIFFEILTIATYPLVVHAGTPKAKHAGRLYLVYTLTAGACLLGAIVWTLSLVGHVSFVPQGILPANLPTGVLVGLFTLFTIGFAVKAGLMPFHAWLPIAMVAPTPVSALLHAVAVVKAGAFGYYRMLHFVFGPDVLAQTNLWQVLAWMAAATILISSFIALRQDEIKRRLAYSTIGHLSYILLGAAILVPAGAIGSLLHLANHAMMKITLFFCAGAIHVAAHKDRVSQLDGLGWRMPWTFGAFTVCALGLAGIPGICGFISKWWLCRGTIEAGQPWLMVILLASGVLNLAYLLPIITRGFKPIDHPVTIKEAPLTMLIPLVATAALSIAFGIIAPLIGAQINLAQMSLTNLVSIP